MSSVEGFVVVDRTGKLKRPRRSAPSIFLKQKVAENKAAAEGDAVQRIVIDLDQEPVFIRGKKL